MRKVLYIVLFCVGMFTLPVSSYAQCTIGNPPVDFADWNYSLTIEQNFNAARRWEEDKRGLAPLCLGYMTAPLAGWGALSNAAIALYIQNNERTARGLLPFHGVETTLSSVSQAHSQWQVDNDVFDHTGDPSLGEDGFYYACPSDTQTDGSTVEQRIDSETNLAGCWQGYGENIALAGDDTHFVASSIYLFMYSDAASGWGHRENILQVMNNNWGGAASEGFIGVGIAQSSTYTMSYWGCSGSYTAFILTIDYIDPFSSCSSFNFSSIYSDLPVGLPAELSHFAAAPRESHVQLDWITETESNVDYFNVERSRDGRQFAAIGQHAAAGNSQTQQRYQWTDTHPLAGTSYYRLRTVDADGTAEYSPVRQVAFGQVQSWRVFPNPAKDAVTLTAAVPIADVANVTLADARGVVFRPTWYPRSDQTLELDVATLPSGIYFLSVSTSTQVWTERVVKQ